MSILKIEFIVKIFQQIFQAQATLPVNSTKHFKKKEYQCKTNLKRRSYFTTHCEVGIKKLPKSNKHITRK